MNHEHIRCLLIDLDDTLYPQDNGLWQLIRDRIHQFMLEQFPFSHDEVEQLRHRLWRQYGTTLRGLVTEYDIDSDAYLEFVHDIPLENYLGPDPELNQMLQDLPQRKVIFTNASAPHASRVMDVLGVSEQFDQIIDILAISPYCKPQPEAFHKALALINEQPQYCLLVDDSPVNLEAAQALGIATVSIGHHHHDGSPHIESIKQLAGLFRL